MYIIEIPLYSEQRRQQQQRREQENNRGIKSRQFLLKCKKEKNLAKEMLGALA